MKFVLVFLMLFSVNQESAQFNIVSVFKKTVKLFGIFFFLFNVRGTKTIVKL